MKLKLFFFVLISILSVGCLFLVNNNLNLQLQQQEITYSGKLDELSAYQQQLVNRISLLEENFSALKQSYDELQEAYNQYIEDSTIERENLQTTVNSLNATISELETNSDIDKNQIAELREEVSALETSLENQTTTANQFKATVEQQEVTINNLNTRIESLIEELNSDLVTISAFQNLLEGEENVSLTAEDLGEINSIRAYAFYGVNNLISIEFPETCKTINLGAFSGVESLKTVDATSVETIGRNAFGYCSNLETFSTSSSLSTIENGAFSYCSSLNAFDFGNSTTIPDNCFSNCSALENIDNVANVTSVGNNAFSNCSLISDFNFDSVQTIGSSAFVSCAFENLILPNTAVSVGSNAFKNNLNLTEVYMPDSITSQGANIFAYCSALTKMTVPFIGLTPEQAVDTKEVVFGFFFGTSGDIEKMYNIQQHYIGITTNANLSCYIPNGLREISVLGGNLCAGAFDRMNLVEKIDVSGCNWIDSSGTFYSCTHLVDLTLPESIAFTAFEQSTFCNTYALPSIVIPEGITELGTKCFGSSGIKTISLPSTLTTLGKECFRSLKNSINIVLPDSVSVVKDYTFGYTYNNHVNIYVPDLANLQYLTEYNYDKLFYQNGSNITLYTGSAEVPAIYPENWNYDTVESAYVELKFNYTAEQFLAEVSA